MCTIGAIRQGNRTLLLKNFDYPPPVSVSWSYFHTFGKEIPHFGLVDHFQQGVNSGLNIKRLGLVIAESDPSFWEKRKSELRTVINAELLANYKSVPRAVQRLRVYAHAHPEMIGGNVILGDVESIAVMEYLRGRTRSKIIQEGFLARANHSIFGLRDNDFDNFDVNTRNRGEEMLQFLESLFLRMPFLDREGIVRRCKRLLEKRPVFNQFTLSSMVIDIQGRRVEFKMRDGKWQTFRLTPSRRGF